MKRFFEQIELGFNLEASNKSIGNLNAEEKQNPKYQVTVWSLKEKTKLHVIMKKERNRR